MAGNRHTSLGDIRIKPDRPRVVEKAVRVCGVDGCREQATHRVPKSRERLEEHLWLCLTHARAHNEAWDFFAGMTDAVIERFQNEGVMGHRPTWPLGKRAARARTGEATFSFKDDFGIFTGEAAPPRPRAPVRQLTGVQIQALSVLNLEQGASLHEIKLRYKELVKRFHPDANGGDRGAEERLKQVIKAYSVLRAAGLT
jgi:hypothetical protein